MLSQIGEIQMNDFGDLSDSDMRFMRIILAVLAVSIAAALGYLSYKGINPILLLMFPGNPDVIRTAKHIVAIGFALIALITGLHKAERKTDFRPIMLMLIIGFGCLLSGYSPRGSIRCNPDRTFFGLFVVLTIAGFLLGLVIRWGFLGRQNSPKP